MWRCGVVCLDKFSLHGTLLRITSGPIRKFSYANTNTREWNAYIIYAADVWISPKRWEYSSLSVCCQNPSTFHNPISIILSTPHHTDYHINANWALKSTVNHAMIDNCFFLSHFFLQVAGLGFFRSIRIGKYKVLIDFAIFCGRSTRKSTLNIKTAYSPSLKHVKPTSNRTRQNPFWKKPYSLLNQSVIWPTHRLPRVFGVQIRRPLFPSFSEPKIINWLPQYSETAYWIQNFNGAAIIFFAFGIKRKTKIIQKKSGEIFLHFVEVNIIV